MEDEYKILENTVKDFNQKFLENNLLRIEKEGIPDNIKRAMVEQGFMGMVQLIDGNRTLDRRALSVLIETLASSSPSVAMDVFITNSLFSMMADEASLNEVSQGIKSGTVGFADLMMNYENEDEIHLNNGILRGTKKYILKTEADYVIVSTKDGELYLVKSGFRNKESHRKLGFRGLSFGTLEFNSNDYIKIGNREDLERVYMNSTPFVVAMAIGISEGAIKKAIEYSKVRTAFGSPLKDFQPIAFSLTSQYNELSIVKESLYQMLSGEPNISKSLYLKMHALELAKEITKNSIQVHGGYGYIEDYGVEKFYRDIMALSVLLYNEEKEKRELAKFLYEGDAGII